MINVLIPMVSVSNDRFFKEHSFPYPKPLIEIKGKMMIERSLEFYQGILSPKRFIFVIDEDFKQDHHLDNILKQITKDECKVVSVQSSTKGALCSALLALEHMSEEDELVICNYDQIILCDPNSILNEARKNDSCALTFTSLHPRWSFALTDHDNNICRVAEKNPISNKAIAGFYYFKKVSDFKMAGFQTIRKQDSRNGIFFISHTLNQLILKGHQVKSLHLKPGTYFSLFSPEKLNEFKKSVTR